MTTKQFALFEKVMNKYNNDKQLCKDLKNHKLYKEERKGDKDDEHKDDKSNKGGKKEKKCKITKKKCKTTYPPQNLMYNQISASEKRAESLIFLR